MFARGFATPAPHTDTRMQMRFGSFKGVLLEYPEFMSHLCEESAALQHGRSSDALFFRDSMHKFRLPACAPISPSSASSSPSASLPRASASGDRLPKCPSCSGACICQSQVEVLSWNKSQPRQAHIVLAVFPKSSSYVAICCLHDALASNNERTVALAFLSFPGRRPCTRISSLCSKHVAYRSVATVGS